MLVTKVDKKRQRFTLKLQGIAEVNNDIHGYVHRWSEPGPLPPGLVPLAETKAPPEPDFRL